MATNMFTDLIWSMVRLESEVAEADQTCMSSTRCGMHVLSCYSKELLHQHHSSLPMMGQGHQVLFVIMKKSLVFCVHLI